MRSVKNAVKKVSDKTAIRGLVRDWFERQNRPATAQSLTDALGSCASKSAIQKTLDELHEEDVLLVKDMKKVRFYFLHPHAPPANDDGNGKTDKGAGSFATDAEGRKQEHAQDCEEHTLARTSDNLLAGTRSEVARDNADDEDASTTNMSRVDELTTTAGTAQAIRKTSSAERSKTENSNNNSVHCSEKNDEQIDDNEKDYRDNIVQNIITLENTVTEKKSVLARLRASRTLAQRRAEMDALRTEVTALQSRVTELAALDAAAACDERLKAQHVQSMHRLVRRYHANRQAWRQRKDYTYRFIDAVLGDTCSVCTIAERTGMITDEMQNESLAESAVSLPSFLAACSHEQAHYKKVHLL